MRFAMDDMMNVASEVYTIPYYGAGMAIQTEDALLRSYF